MSERAPRKAQTGRVVSDRMDKTVVVAVERRTRHRLYRKSIKHVSRFAVHDETNEYRLGDLVRIVETRPISRTKRWRVAELLARADVADVAAAIAADVPKPEIEPALEEAAAEEPAAEAKPEAEETVAEEPVAEAEPEAEEAAAEEPDAEATAAPRKRTRAAPKAKAAADAPAAEADAPAEPEEASGDDAEKEAKS